MGFLTILSRIIVIIGFGMYIYGMVNLIIRNSRSKTKTTHIRIKENPANLILLLLCLIFLMVESQLKLTYEYNGTLEMNINILVVCLMVGLGIAFGIAQIVGKKKPIQDSDVIQHVLSTKPAEELYKYTLVLDLERKSNHLVAFIIALGSVSIGGVTVWILVKTLNWDYPQYQFILDKRDFFWAAPEGTFLQNIFNTNLFSTSRTILSVTFTGVTLLLLIIEYARLSSSIYFPFQQIVQRQLRWEEKNAVGSYIYLITGLAVASFLLPSIMFLGVACVVSLGDSAASIIGMKFGKRKYPHNNKTIEGTIVASIVTFISVFLFSGVWFAITAVFVFVLIDLICPNPLKMNDNLLLPLVLSGVFIVLFVLGVPYPSVVEYFLH
jgi:dolichol kinase